MSRSNTPVAGSAAGAVPEPGAPASPSVGEPSPRWTLVVVCAAVFMLLLDVTIVAVALGDMQRDLDAGLSALQWVVDAYTLTLAGGLLTAATLGDRIGRRRIFMIGLMVFTLASLACALAGDALILDVFRAVQGLGAALLFGTALPLLGAAFPQPAARARAIGAFGATLAAATAIGPLVGGALVDGPGWRWIFLINVPVGALTLLGGLRLAESRPAHAPRTDWLGAVTLTGSLVLLALGLIRGNDDGWASARILSMFAGSALLLAGFVVWERRTTEPMLDLTLFARPAFVGVALQAFAIAGTLVAATYYIALYLQNSVGFSPFDTGLRFLPLTVTSFVAAPVTAALLRRIGTSSALVAGVALSAVGALLASRIGAGVDWTVLVAGLVAGGLGLGMGAASSASAALAAVEPARAGMATGTVNTMRQVGTAAGVAMLGALFQHEATRHATERLAALTALPEAARHRLAGAIGSGLGKHAAELVPAGLQRQVAAAATAATADALSTVLLAAGIAAVAATALCGVLLWSGRRTAPAADTADDADAVYQVDAADAAVALH